RGGGAGRRRDSSPAGPPAARARRGRAARPAGRDAPARPWRRGGSTHRSGRRAHGPSTGRGPATSGGRRRPPPATPPPPGRGPRRGPAHRLPRADGIPRGSRSSSSCRRRWGRGGRRPRRGGPRSRRRRGPPWSRSAYVVRSPRWRRPDRRPWLPPVVAAGQNVAGLLHLAVALRPGEDGLGDAARGELGQPVPAGDRDELVVGAHVAGRAA